MNAVVLSEMCFFLVGKRPATQVYMFHFVLQVGSTLIKIAYSICSHRHIERTILIFCVIKCTLVRVIYCYP